MQHADIRKALAEQVIALLESSHKLPRPFRPYQVETTKKHLEWLRDLSGTRRSYVEHATGLGKTELFRALAAFCTRLRVLIVEPSKVLVEQTVRRVAEYSGGLVGYLASVPLIYDETEDGDKRLVGVRGTEVSNILVTTDESFKSQAIEIARGFSPDIILFDECHWGHVGDCQRVFNYFPEAVITGYSATPDNLGSVHRPGYIATTLNNGQVLYAAPHRRSAVSFGTLLDRRTFAWGVEDGWLSTLAWGEIDFSSILDDLSMHEGELGVDFKRSEMIARMGSEWKQAIARIRNLYRSGRYDLANRRVFAVCPSVPMAQELAEAIRILGVPSACIVAGTNTTERRHILGPHHQLAGNLITSVGVLKEGWDGWAEVFMMFKPTVNYTEYVQPLGRIMRYAPGKVSLVLDARFTETKHEPISAAQLVAPVGSQIRRDDILVTARAGAAGFAPPVTRSPYLSAESGDPMTVTPFFITNCAGTDGVFWRDGEEWGTERTLLSRFPEIINPKLLLFDGGFKTCNAHDHLGRMRKFYSLKSVREYLARHH